MPAISRRYGAAQFNVVTVGTIAAAITACLSITYGFLESAGFPKLSMFWVWGVMGLVWGAVACLRQTTQKQLGSNATVVSFAKLPFPHLAPYAALFRGVIRVQAQGQTVRLLSDLVLVGRNRTELTLSVVGPAQAKKQISAAEYRLARALIARGRA